jgi:hypothetical protein
MFNPGLRLVPPCAQSLQWCMHKLSQGSGWAVSCVLMNKASEGMHKPMRPRHVLSLILWNFGLTQ